MHSRMGLENTGEFLAFSPHLALSSPGQCAIAHQDRATQYAEAARLEPKSRSVLDAPPSRGMTASAGM
jgi:hypothetical protein